MTLHDIIDRALFFFRGVSAATIDDATDENIKHSLVEHGKTAARATASAVQGSKVNGKLRETLREARTKTFAEFEGAIRHKGERL